MHLLISVASCILLVNVRYCVTSPISDSNPLFETLRNEGKLLQTSRWICQLNKILPIIQYESKTKHLCSLTLDGVIEAIPASLLPNLQPSKEIEASKYTLNNGDSQDSEESLSPIFRFLITTVTSTVSTTVSTVTINLSTWRYIFFGEFKSYILWTY